MCSKPWIVNFKCHSDHFNHPAMKRNLCQQASNQRLIRYFALLLLCMSFTGLFAQQQIYLKNGTMIQPSQLDTTGKLCIYRLQEDPPGVEHYLSTEGIDSIRYRDGHVVKFSDQGQVSRHDESNTRNNLIGINVPGLFSSRINIFYERLFMNDLLGFKSSFLVNAGDKQINMENINQTARYYLTSGMNYYFLNSPENRMGAGMSLLAGKFNADTSDLMRDIESDHLFTDLLFNFSFSQIIHERYFITADLEFPVRWKGDFGFFQFIVEFAYKF